MINKNAVDRERLVEAFEEYTSLYDVSNPKTALKITHTVKVADLCDQIAQSLHLSARDCDLAYTMGMLHDIGRFEQIKRFNTFIDSESVDHAQFGADLLFREGLLSRFGDFSEEDTDLLETTIRNHSVYRMPNSLSERELMFCNILRDADKIDIIRANVMTPTTDVYNFTERELYSSDVTPAVAEAFFEFHTVRRDLKKQPADYVVALLSLTFELVFPISRQIIREQGYIYRMLDFPSENSHVLEIFKEMRRKMNEFLI